MIVVCGAALSSSDDMRAGIENWQKSRKDMLALFAQKLSKNTDLFSLLFSFPSIVVLLFVRMSTKQEACGSAVDEKRAAAELNERQDAFRTFRRIDSTRAVSTGRAAEMVENAYPDQKESFGWEESWESGAQDASKPEHRSRAYQVCAYSVGVGTTGRGAKLGACRVLLVGDVRSLARASFLAALRTTPPGPPQPTAAVSFIPLAANTMERG
ncbi:hypothetical protein B0H16DRAFT_1462603 [Mycena metata]|uniref:Uncharacterized protein n=1 Tax=Mycena metata TaxID=1033252 RepID=A0AAD7IP96_9AGAR|nr:hypothetical protein B0H16DRAFT_1462603 [Mycena metata]